MEGRRNMPPGQDRFPRLGSSRPTYKPVTKLYRPPYFISNSLSFVAMVIGMVLFFMAFGGPAWYEVPEERSNLPKTFGLWQFCVRGQCVVNMDNDYMVRKYLAEYPLVIPAYERYLMPVKVLMCFGVVVVLVMVLSNFAFITGYPTFFLETITQLLAGLLEVISVGIFGGFFRDDYKPAPFGWSYWVAVVSALILIVNGIIMGFISVWIYRRRGNSFYRNK